MTDTEILEWVLPVITGEIGPVPDKRTLLIGAVLTAGLSGREALLAAMKYEKEDQS